MTTDVVIRAPTPEEIAQAQLPARYESACKAIAECVRIDELKDLADRQAALASYAKQAKDDSMMRLAQRIQLRAVRRCGELLKQIPDTNRGRPVNSGDTRPNLDGWIPGTGTSEPSLEGWLPGYTRSKAATDAGMTEHGKKNAIRVASVSPDEFEAAVQSDTPPTVTALAERGKVSRALEPPVPAHPAQVAQAMRLLREFAALCGTHDPRAIGCAPGVDAELMRGYVGTVVGWLDRFVMTLLTEDAA